MSTQILERSMSLDLLSTTPVAASHCLLPNPVDQMSTRVDALEASIQDIINGDVSVSVPQSPSPGTPAAIR
jgi:hypothetical protein